MNASFWHSSGVHTGLRPTGTSTPDGVPAGDLIGRHEAAIPAGMVFLRRLFRWWRFADHRLMALKLHSGPDRHEALPPPPVINPQSPCFCRITIFYSSELALIRGFFRLAWPILKTQPSSSVALATMSGWRMRAVPTRMALAQLGHVRLP